MIIGGEAASGTSPSNLESDGEFFCIVLECEFVTTSETEFVIHMIRSHPADAKLFLTQAQYAMGQKEIAGGGPGGGGDYAEDEVDEEIDEDLDDADVLVLHGSFGDDGESEREQEQEGWKKSLLRELEQSRNENRQLVETFETLNRTIETLQEGLDQKQEMLEAFREGEEPAFLACLEKDDLRREVMALTEENVKLRESRNRYREDTEQLIEKLAALDEENVNLKAQLTEATETVPESIPFNYEDYFDDEEPGEEEIRIESDDEEDGRLSCEYCQESFSKQEDLKDHLQGEHSL